MAVNTSESFDRVRDSDGLRSMLSAMLRRWPLVLAVVVASTVVAVALHERSKKSYSATASVAFQAGTLSDSALQISPIGTGEPQREANTEVLIAHSPEVAEAVRKQLKLDSTTKDLLKEVTVEVAPSADVLEIVASASDPTTSAQLANAFAEQYIAFRAKSELQGISTAQSKLEEQIKSLPSGSSEREGLTQSVQRLSELRAVAGGGANIIGRAGTPTEPSGMGLKTTAAIGLLVGVAIAFSLVFMLESLDRRVKSADEFALEYRSPLLSSVPQAGFRTALAERRTEALEPYRVLRSALDFSAVARDLDTVLVTSAVSGEGKTTVAVDLAHAVALTGRRTVLIEVDLRRPSFARHFASDSRMGLSDALVGHAPAKSLLVEPLDDVPDLHVMFAGRRPPNPAELLASARISEIISELAEPGTMVIIDAPPLNPVADAQSLLNLSAIHAALIVARLGMTTKDDVHRARTVLDNHMVRPVGVVVTGIRDSSAYAYESYGSRSVSMPSLDLPADVLSRPRRRSLARRPRA